MKKFLSVEVVLIGKILSWARRLNLWLVGLTGGRKLCSTWLAQDRILPKSFLSADLIMS